jgi:hypothetical protein
LCNSWPLFVFVKCFAFGTSLASCSCAFFCALSVSNQSPPERQLAACLQQSATGSVAVVHAAVGNFDDLAAAPAHTRVRAREAEPSHEASIAQQAQPLEQPMPGLPSMPEWQSIPECVRRFISRPS